MEVSEKIIWFMLGKAEKVKEICDVEYFTNEDIEYIRVMDKDKLEFAWDMIRWYVDDFEYGLGGPASPFCIYYCREIMGRERIYCALCPYGKLHGICSEADSDYKKIVESKNFSSDMFPNEFYKGLIRDIENY